MGRAVKSGSEIPVSGVPVLDQTIIGTAAIQGYSATKRSSFDSYPLMRGRTRYKLKDTFAYYTMNLTFEMSRDQFYAWQLFWTIDLNHGMNEFYTSLMMDDPDIFVLASERYIVRALQPWSASATHNNRWIVTMQVETASGVKFELPVCPDIYGGPIFSLAEDVVYGGEPNALPVDVIAPCPYVLI